MRVLISSLSLYLVAVSLSSISGAAINSEARSCNDGLGVCTPFSKCSNQTEFFDGAGFLNVRFNVEPEPEDCHYLEMCCDEEDIISDDFFIPAVLPIIPPLIESKIKTDCNLDETNCTNEKERTNEPTEPTDSEKRFNSKEEEDATTENVVTLTTENPNFFNWIIPFQTVKGDCNDDKDYECIQFSLCNEEITHDGAGLFQTRMSVEIPEVVKTCKVSSYVCCKKENNVARQIPNECGIRNPNGVSQKVEAKHNESQFGEFPWVAALLERDENDEYQYFCSGSLIHSKVILTAAHCLIGKDVNKIKVRLGEWDTKTTAEPMPHTEQTVESFEIHPQFGEKNLHNDFALMVLDNDIQMTAHISTICLPPSGVNFDNDECFATGWGKDHFNDEKAYRTNLKKLVLPVVPLKKCQDSLRQTILGDKFKIDRSFMCAGGEAGVDTCTGDGGAPLVCENPGKPGQYFQAGAVAWGVKCGEAGVPGVYANIVKAREWIDENMKTWGFGIGSYTPKDE